MSEITPTLGLRQSLNAYRTAGIKLLKEPVLGYEHDPNITADANYQLASKVKIQLVTQLNTYQQKIQALQTAADKYAAGVQEIINNGAKADATQQAKDLVKYEINKMQETLYSDSGIYPLLDKMRDNTAIIAAQLDNAKQHIEWFHGNRASGKSEGLFSTVAKREPETPMQLVRLPKIELETYDGDPLVWESWWQIFKAQIHDRKEVSDGLKFTYLSKALKGEAKQLLAGLKVDGTDYHNAIDMLKANFGDTSQVTNALWDKLLTIEKPSSRGDSLMKFTRAVISTLNQLKDRGEHVETGVVLKHLKTTVPSNIMLAINDEHRNANRGQPEVKMDVDRFVMALTEVAKARLDSMKQPSDSTETSSVTPKKNAKGGKSMNSSNNTVAFSSASSAVKCSSTKGFQQSNKGGAKGPQMGVGGGAPPIYNCLFCGQKTHYSTDCKKVATRADRLTFLRNQPELCIRCTRKNHMAKNCTTPLSCYYCREKNKHHSTLCPEKFGDKAQQVVQISMPTEVVPQRSAMATTVAASQLQAGRNVNPGGSIIYPSVRLQLAQSYLFNPDSEMMSEKMDIFFDTGCEYSYIQSTVAEELELEPKSSVLLSMHIFAVKNPIKVRAKLVDVIIPIKSKDRSEDLRLTLRSLKELATYVQPPPLSIEDKNYIESIWGADAEKLFAAPLHNQPQLSKFHKLSRPAVVIGQDNYWKFNIRPTEVQLPSGLIMVDSAVGFMLAGTTQTSSESESEDEDVSIASYAVSSSAIAVAKETLRQFHELEIIGIGDDPYTVDDDIAEELILNSIVFDRGENRYIVDWPYKDCISDLPTNKHEAFSRFMSLLRRFQRDPQLYEQYTKVINDQLQKGILEPCYGEPEKGAQAHYLPHQPVLTPGKSTSCRIVYDGSAGKPSLNECLYRGPINTPQSLGLMLRFRAGKVVLMADIEKAFLQIALHPAAKDFTRFYWLKDTSQLSTVNNLQIMRFTRVLFGLVCSPSILGTVIKYHLEKEAQNIRGKNPKRANQIIKTLNNIYVDNFLISLNDENEAIEIYNLVKSIFSNCSMNMREWLSNSQHVTNNIPEHDRSPKSGQTLGILGIKYDPEFDTLTLSTPKLEPSKVDVPTRRNLNKLLASAYDPMGFTAPAVLTLKFQLSNLLQQTKTSKWDEIITDPKAEELLELLQTHLTQLYKVQFFRSLQKHGIDVSDSERGAELHVFCDASKIGYATCAYIRQVEASNSAKFNCTFLTARTKLAPLPSKTGTTTPITRLELLSVTIGAKLISYLHEELVSMGGWKITKIFLWTDSTVAIGWLKTAKPLATFVKNRVSTINEVISTFKVRLAKVPTEVNPADIASRGCSVDEVMTNAMWQNGPEFLTAELTEEFLDISAYHQVTTELSKSPEKIARPIWAGAAAISQQINIQKISAISSNPLQLDITRFGTLSKLLNTIVRVLRLIKFFKNRNLEDSSSNFLSQPIQHAEHQQAWRQALRIAQFEECSSLIQQVQSGQHPEYTWDSKNQLILRQVRLPGEDRKSLGLHLLPRTGHLTYLTISHYHRANQHGGLLHTVADLRENCWLPNAKRIVSKHVRDCVSCRKAEGGPFSLPEFHTLPSTRTQAQVKPFQHCGIDFMGPLYYSLQGVKYKHHILLITCFSTRAVHLESCHSVSTADTINALNRFVSRRGMPQSIYSDNAPAFRNCVKSFTSVTWKFATAYSPWQGGVYERMVGLVKRVLKKACGRRMLTWDEFNTVMLDVEFAVNTRPLTCLSASDAGAAILRPIHFLWGVAPIESQLSEKCSTVDCLDKLELNSIAEKERDNMLQLWATIQQNRQILWNEWSRQYLDLLKDAQTRIKPKRGEVTEKPQLGQIVLVKIDKQPRGAWHLGQIRKFNYSSDGKIRSITVATNHSTLEQSPIHLYPLEIPYSTSVCMEPNPEEIGKVEEKKVVSNQNSIQQIKSQSLRKAPKRACHYAGTYALWSAVISIMALPLWGASATSNTWSQHYHQNFNLCHKTRTGHAIQVPHEVHCNFPPTENVKEVQVKLWSLRKHPQHTEIFRCYEQEHVIITYMSIVGGKAMLPPEILRNKLVTVAECQQAFNTKSWKGIKLVKINEAFWSTNSSLKIEYCYFCSQRNNAITNFHIEIGTVASLDGLKLVTEIQDLSHCNPAAGYCTDHENGVAIWNASIFQHQCSFEKFGIYEAKMAHQHFIIESIQAAFSVLYQHKRPERAECVPANAKYTDQGSTFIEVLQERSKPEIKSSQHVQYNFNQFNSTDKGIVDLANFLIAQCQFTIDQISMVEKQQFALIWQQLCYVRQTQLKIINQLITFNPTLGLRALLGRENVYAEWHGDILMFWECKLVKAKEIYFNHQFNNTCYKFLPILIENHQHLLFVAPGTNDVITHSPVDNCQFKDHKYYQLNDKTWANENGRTNLHITQMPLELVWKGNWQPFVLNVSGAPGKSMTDIAFSLTASHHHIQRLHQLEGKVSRSVQYLSTHSNDPQAIQAFVAGLGQGAGAYFEGIVAEDDWQVVQPRRRRPQTFNQQGKKRLKRLEYRFRKRQAKFASKSSSECHSNPSTEPQPQFQPSSTSTSVSVEEQEPQSEHSTFNMEEHPPNSIRITIPGPRESWKTRFDRIFGPRNTNSESANCDAETSSVNSVTNSSQNMAYESSQSTQSSSEVQLERSKSRKSRNRSALNKSPFHRKSNPSNHPSGRSSTVPIAIDASTTMQNTADAGNSPITEEEFQDVNPMECDQMDDPEELLPNE